MGLAVAFRVNRGPWSARPECPRDASPLLEGPHPPVAGHLSGPAAYGDGQQCTRAVPSARPQERPAHPLPEDRAGQGPRRERGHRQGLRDRARPLCDRRAGRAGGAAAGVEAHHRPGPVRRHLRDRPALFREALLCRSGRRDGAGSLQCRPAGPARQPKSGAGRGRPERPREPGGDPAFRQGPPPGDVARSRRGQEGVGLLFRDRCGRGRQGSARARARTDQAQDGSV